MNMQTIACPKCGTEIEASVALTAQMRAVVNQELEGEHARLRAADEARIREDYAARLEANERELKEKQTKLHEATTREVELTRRERELSEKEARDKLAAEEFLKLERARIQEEAKKLAAEEHANDRWQLEAELKMKTDQLQAARAAELEVQKKALDLQEKERTFELRVGQGVEVERERIAKEAEARGRTSAELQQKQLQAELGEVRLQLDEAQTAELALRKQQREVEEQKRQIDLEIQRRVDAERAIEQKRLETERQDITAQATEKAREEAKVQLTQSEIQIARLNEQIQRLQRSAENGSQELQGEALEEVVKRTLVEVFRFDTVDDIKKGVRGADLLHVVRDASLKECGRILWEVKNANNWNDGWAQKLKEDQLQAQADVAVIVTASLPKGIKNFGLYDGVVWVTNVQCLAGLAAALRHTLVRISNERILSEDRESKMELLYKFLTSAEFRLRTQAIITYAQEMMTDLEKEKAAAVRRCNRRLKETQLMLERVTGMVGSLEGIVSQPLLEASDEEEEGEPTLLELEEVCQEE